MSDETTKRNEAVAEIVAEWMPHFQKYADPHEESAGFDMAGDAVSALEEVLAASKRDGEMLKAARARVRELDGLLGGAADALLGAAIRLWEGRTEAPRQNGDAQGAASNTAALREALEGCRDYLYDMLRDAFYDAQVMSHSDNPRMERCEREQQLHREVEAALAAPPRNCDVGTAEEQAQRFQDFCDDSQVDEDYTSICARCTLRRERNCGLAWAQLPYEAPAAQEGGEP